MNAANAVLVQPNVFELEGYNTRISYSSTSITGAPELTYVNRGQTLRFRGEQIRTERTQLGQMVSVTIAADPAAIGPVESLTLLIPAMTLPAETRQGSVQTIVVFSLRSPLTKNSAQSQTFMPLCLAGTAQQLDF